jgi:hypothetical protein
LTLLLARVSNDQLVMHLRPIYHHYSTTMITVFAGVLPLAAHGGSSDRPPFANVTDTAAGSGGCHSGGETAAVPDTLRLLASDYHPTTQMQQLPVPAPVIEFATEGHLESAGVAATGAAAQVLAQQQQQRASGEVLEATLAPSNPLGLSWAADVPAAAVSSQPRGTSHTDTAEAAGAAVDAATADQHNVFAAAVVISTEGGAVCSAAPSHPAGEWLS